MEPMESLPMGFGIALLGNQRALMRFQSMTAPQQEAIIEKTHAVHSKQEMEAFVSETLS